MENFRDLISAMAARKPTAFGRLWRISGAGACEAKGVLPTNLIE
jgi:hypothetical protein